MALETLTGTVYIDDLNSSNPVGATDPKSEGDDHIRGIKNVLKTTFPNINGAVTSTPAELNLLGSQVGGFLLKGSATGAGTADAITADFTPNISLTNGVTVIVRAVGANTVTNPTFNPDGLGVKTIVKNSNEALSVGDIIGASHELILKYNSTNDNWSLLNASQDVHPAAVAGYDRGVTVNLKDDVSYSSFDVDAALTINTWESVGPTGSGASNIWSALDTIPTTATHVILSAIFQCTDGVSLIEGEVEIQGRENGSAVTTAATDILSAYFYTSAAATCRHSTKNIPVPLSSSNIFELLWNSTAGAATESATIYLMGWVE